MNKSDKLPELLSPCGSMESLTAALRCGANAVYVGGKRFSARHNAKNFTPEELSEAVRICHRYGAVIYQAINTCVLDRELGDLADEIETACRSGIDGLIIQDSAAEYIVKTACPDMPIHASTQLTVHTEKGLERLKQRGYERGVLSRELPKEAISRLTKLGIETEVFVHGALCMSVSGQCYLSALIGSRSANRGLCAGACRLPFSAKGKAQDKYALSLKDVCLADNAEELAQMGVTSLKIEGRMKRPEYVAAATHSYRQALDGNSYDTQTLKAVFSRSGFTDGYYAAQTGSQMFGTRSREDVVSAEEVLPKLRELYRKEPALFPISFRFTAQSGKPCVLEASDGKDTAQISGSIPEPAANRPADESFVLAQLSKLGGSLYYLDKADIRLDEGLMLPASLINGMRREAIAALDEARIARTTKIKSFDSEKLSLCRPKTLNLKRPAFWVKVEKLSQLSLLELDQAEKIIIPLFLWNDYLKNGYPIEKAVLSLDRFTLDEDKMIERLRSAAEAGFKTVECTNTAHILIAKDLGLQAIGGFGLNITNSISAFEYAQEGLSALTLSFELKAFQAGMIASPVPTGVVVYGKLPLMLTVNCPVCAQVGCKNCTGSLTDRTGAKFPVLCKKKQGYYELLNSKTLVLSDKLDDFNLDFGILYFTVETAEEAKKVFDNYLSGAKPQGDFTRGLYYRGID